MIKLAIDKNDENMVTNWGFNYIQMVILTCSFCLFKLGFNCVIWGVSFSFNLKEEDAESIISPMWSLTWKKFCTSQFLYKIFNSINGIN